MKSLGFITPLFVPASRPDRFVKAATSGADAVILDLEDSVAPADKKVARANLRHDIGDVPVFVRINAAFTPWYNDDVRAVSEQPFAGIVVPKAAAVRDLHVLTVATQGMPIIALIESAEGLRKAREIAAYSQVLRLAFGAIDFSVDIGCAPTRDALLAARSELVLASRLANISPPLDGPSTVFKGEEVEADAHYAAQLGFSGKLCIHPQQIAFARRGFAPSPEEIEWAKKVQNAPEGASAVDGTMVDLPLRLRAENILRKI